MAKISELLQVVRSHTAIDPKERRRLEILAEIERIRDGRRPIPDNAYSSAGEVREHRFWPPYILAQFTKEEKQ